MSGQAPRQPSGPPRIRLSRERVIAAAMAEADAGGLAGLTIRSLANRLGVKPMSVYHHIASKEEILDGVVDLVFAEFTLPSAGGPWREQVTLRCRSARQALRQHSWAIPLLESRTSPGPATLAHHEAMLATLRAAGFSRALTAHAYALLDAFVYGFAVQEASLPFEGPDTLSEAVGPMIEQMDAGTYPHLVDMATTYYAQPGYDFSAEFDFGLTLVLDGIESALERDAS